jgi:hypothetical protein
MKPLYKGLIALWATWLLGGTIHYKEVLGLGWGTAFYMAVNAGYSIGWGDISEQGVPESQWFSIFYVLMGSSFVR